MRTTFFLGACYPLLKLYRENQNKIMLTLGHLRGLFVIPKGLLIPTSWPHPRKYSSEYRLESITISKATQFPPVAFDAHENDATTFFGYVNRVKWTGSKVTCPTHAFICVSQAHNNPVF